MGYLEPLKTSLGSRTSLD